MVLFHSPDVSEFVVVLVVVLLCVFFAFVLPAVDMMHLSKM